MNTYIIDMFQSDKALGYVHVLWLLVCSRLIFFSPVKLFQDSVSHIASVISNLGWDMFITRPKIYVLLGFVFLTLKQLYSGLILGETT